MAGARAGLREGSSVKGGSREEAGMVARGGIMAGGRHPSGYGAASWSAPALGSLGCKTGVEAGAGSASCAHA